jgi:hypothetical protein
MDDAGEVIKSGKVSNYRSEVEKFLVGIRDVEAVVEAVWPAIRADFDVRCYYERLKKRKCSNSGCLKHLCRFLKWRFREICFAFRVLDRVILGMIP